MKLTKTKFMKEVKSRLSDIRKRGTISISIEYFADELECESTEIVLMFRQCMPDIMKMRDVDSCERVPGSWSDTLVFHAKPCKEYVQLTKYLEKCKLTLMPGDVRIDDISGKRSKFDLLRRRTISHSPVTCTHALEWLKSMKGSTSTCGLKLNSKTYYGDRFDSYGVDMECEWEGHVEHTAAITVYTKTGRVRGEFNVSI